MRDRCKFGCNNLQLPTMAYYFDTKFWEVKIPRIYGFETINSFDSLTDMPNILKVEINNNETLYSRYEVFWTNCIDLTYGLSDLRKFPINKSILAKDFLFAGIENLNAATSALLHSTPNSQSIMNIRMALEMFIKSYIGFNDPSIVNDEQQDKQVRKIGHDLQKGLEAIQKLCPHLIDNSFFEKIKLFPDIADRYIPQRLNIKDISTCYNLSLHFGAIVTRSITDRNILNQ